MAGTTPRTRYCSRCLTTFEGEADRCPNLGCRAGRPAVGWGELMGPGDLIDRTYRVRKLLAIGGAGVTYLAGEVGADGTSEVGPALAVKVLYQQRDQGPYLRRLATEAQILQGLNHPSIVECRGFVHRTGHSPYLVTRFEEGGSLLDHLKRTGILPIDVAAAIGRQVCEALDNAHRQGVVHRDLKPENVLLVKPVDRELVPEVRVADFGIAKVFGGVGERLTRVGAFVGTPQYAAPEQFDGLAPEPATDVYAVGALLFFCVCGRPVADFMAELDPDNQKLHLLRHLPPKLDPDVTPLPLQRWMEDTLAVAMAPDPGDRIEISQLAARLAAIAAHEDPGFVRLPPAPEQVSSPRPLPITGGPAISSGPTMSAETWSAEVSAPFPRAATPPPLPPAAATPPPLPKAVTPAPPPPVSPEPPPTEKVKVTAPPPPEPPRAPMRPPPVTVSSEPEKSSGGLGGVVAVVAMLGVVATLGLGGLGVAWMVLNPSPVRLSHTESDPGRAKDWTLVAGALGERGLAAERACNAPSYLSIEVVVEGDGALRRADLLNYPHEPTRLCVEKALGAKRFPRQGNGPVVVAVQLQR
jgi:serine/threonine-protein kinase